VSAICEAVIVMAEAPELRRVRRAAAARTKADDEYRAALLAAQNAGRSLAEIAKAAGVGRSSVYKVARAAKR
jgi:DNA-binding phage protein